MTSGRAGMAEQIREMARPIAARWGLEVVDVEVLGEGPRTLVRVLAEGTGGVTITVDELARVNEALSRQLDTRDLIPHAYTLEVSSPGLDRPLRGEADFIRFAGRAVEVWLDPPWEGRRHVTGRLLGLRGIGGREVGMALSGGGSPEMAVWMPRAQVTTARLVVDDAVLREDLAKGGRRNG